MKCSRVGDWTVKFLQEGWGKLATGSSQFMINFFLAWFPQSDNYLRVGMVLFGRQAIPRDSRCTPLRYVCSWTCQPDYSWTPCPIFRYLSRFRTQGAHHPSKLVIHSFYSLATTTTVGFPNSMLILCFLRYTPRRNLWLRIQNKMNISSRTHQVIDTPVTFSASAHAEIFDRPGYGWLMRRKVIVSRLK